MIFNVQAGQILQDMDVRKEATGYFLVKQPLEQLSVKLYAFNKHHVKGVALLGMLMDVIGKVEQRFQKKQSTMVWQLLVQISPKVGFFRFQVFV